MQLVKNGVRQRNLLNEELVQTNLKKKKVTLIKKRRAFTRSSIRIHFLWELFKRKTRNKSQANRVSLNE